MSSSVSELDTLFAAGLQKLHVDELQTVFNYERPDLKPTTIQQEILTDETSNVINVLGGNRSGKSQIGARILTWWFNETHPHMKRPVDWGSGPLTLMVIGRVGEQIESELFAKKIQPYLISGTYKTHRIAGNLARIVHIENGNRMIFFSHHNVNEAREKVQAFTTNVIWLDEMADSASFISELMTRIITTNGKLICTFTPLVRSEEVRRMIDTPTKISKKYVLSMLDNPMLLEDPKKMELALEAYSNLSEAERNTRLYGDWFIGDHAVYPFDSSKNIRGADNYSYSWRHIAVVDPAAAGKSGLSVWGEDPTSGKWYCVLAEYISGPIASGDLVELVEKKIRNYHIIRRVADPHETNYFLEAGKRRINYMGVYKKNERKKELIDQIKNALVKDEIVLTPPVTLLANEFISCQWKDGIEHERIINASSYHLLDTAQYFLDNKPKFVPNQPISDLQSFESRLRQANKEKKTKIAKAKLKRGRRWRH